jgi:hypothetical protein
MFDPKTLTEKAERARRLANSISDQNAVEALRSLAVEYEEKVRRHENRAGARALASQKETPLSDDKNQTGSQDRKRISLSEDYEVRDWSEKFGVSEERLRAAVANVGNMAEDVERELRGS